MTAASASPSAEFWEPRYAGASPEWGHEPNARLVAVLPRLALRPGLAWDLGCGHGGDVFWLASLGWHVTATAVSATAVRRVAGTAMELELRDRVTAERVRPGGCFVLIDHGRAAPWSWRPDGREPEFQAPPQILAGISPGPGWVTEMCERPRRIAAGPDGQTATVADNVIVLRRR